ncbi:hypothetical protein A203_13960 [Chromobacterium violaceum]|uniref:hypothetical protein n=1 Tax=Chromobacterium violaceum TaxID=536 RepID=UPI003CF243D5
MGNLIEHDGGDGDRVEVVCVGDGESPVPLKIYQDIYQQITGRTEQIRKRYSENLLMEMQDIEQLNHHILQLCDIHNVIASNVVVSVFHEKERKEQFTSFERFRLYNANSTSPTVSLVIKYSFSIIPGGLERPQEYSLTIRLISRVAMMKKIEQDAPPFAIFQVVNLFSLNTAEVTVDYVDYVIARGFLEAFEEWVDGCRKIPTMTWLNFLRKWSHLTPSFARIFMGMLISIFAFKSVPVFFSSYSTPIEWAYFFVAYSCGVILLIPLMSGIGHILESAIDSYPILSYLRLNKGDSKLVEEFSHRKRGAVIKFIVGLFLSMVCSIIASRLDRIIGP